MYCLMRKDHARNGAVYKQDVFTVHTGSKGIRTTYGAGSTAHVKMDSRSFKSFDAMFSAATMLVTEKREKGYQVIAEDRTGTYDWETCPGVSAIVTMTTSRKEINAILDCLRPFDTGLVVDEFGNELHVWPRVSPFGPLGMVARIDLPIEPTRALTLVDPPKIHVATSENLLAVLAIAQKLGKLGHVKYSGTDIDPATKEPWDLAQLVRDQGFRRAWDVLDAFGRHPINRGPVGRLPAPNMGRVLPLGSVVQRHLSLVL